MLDLITLIFRANSRTDKEDILQTAREHIEVIRLYMRALFDMKQINLKQFDRTHNEGWQFHKNKYLDLCPLDNYQILTSHQQKP